MPYSLIIVHGGIIDNFKFFDDKDTAIRALAKFVQQMNPEKDDAAVYGPEGFTANTKSFLDENDNSTAVDH